VSRSQFYEYKRAFQEHGLSRLIDKPPIPGPHPNEISEETRQRIIDMSLEYPSAGQQRIADQLQLEGLSVSPGTVCNVWIKEDMETRYKRLLLLEEKATSRGLQVDRGTYQASGEGESLFP